MTQKKGKNHLHNSLEGCEPEISKQICFLQREKHIIPKNNKVPLIIDVRVARKHIPRVLIDDGSSKNIIYERYFQRLPTEVKENMKTFTEKVTSFTGEKIETIGKIKLHTTIGSRKNYTTIPMGFLIIRSLSP